MVHKAMYCTQILCQLNCAKWRYSWCTLSDFRTHQGTQASKQTVTYCFPVNVGAVRRGKLDLISPTHEDAQPPPSHGSRAHRCWNIDEGITLYTILYDVLHLNSMSTRTHTNCPYYLCIQIYSVIGRALESTPRTLPSGRGIVAYTRRSGYRSIHETH